MNKTIINLDKLTKRELLSFILKRFELEKVIKIEYELIINNTLKEFNWRWKSFLKDEYTQQQFSTGFRKYLVSFNQSKTYEGEQ